MKYVDVTSNGEVCLMGMSTLDAHDLKCMIKGADLPQRRTFNSVLQQLREIEANIETND